jgi:predicted sulfurtransferase
VEPQLFPSLSIKATREVVSLHGPSHQQVKEQSNNGRKRRQKQKGDSTHQSLEKEKDTLDDTHNKLYSSTLSPNDEILQNYQPAPHLSPHEWNQRLLECKDDAILVDARNVYESRVGYFSVDGIPTLLTNTRKYSYLPQVLQQSREALQGKRVFMYCTGGVRCERASVYLQAMMSNSNESGPKEIFQLEGGIQRYLEDYGSINDNNNEECLYQGKNFVFDLRRTDPIVGVSKKGTCVLCEAPHDDYDNGHAPSEQRDARCCKCRMLVLVCNDCRNKVRSWGEQGKEILPELYCGGLSRCIDDGNCVQSTIV